MKDRTYKAIILISLCLCILHTAYERFFVADWHDREWNEGAWRGRVDWWGFFWGLILWDYNNCSK